MSQSKHPHVHPVFASLLDAIAPIGDPSPNAPVAGLGRRTEDLTGHLDSASERRYIAEVAQMAINPIQAAYRRLVEELAANVGDEGLYDVKQLRPLTNAERATILRANPDVLNDFTFEPEQIAEMIQGAVDPRTWIVACTDPALRKWLFDDVVDEIQRDEEIVRQDAMDPYQRRGEAV